MWDLNDLNAPESEAVQSEREIVEAIVEQDLEARLAVATPLHNGTLDERVETAGRDECDNCHLVAELSHHDATGLALCDGCYTLAENDHHDTIGLNTAPPVDTTVRFKRLRNNAWGIIGPSALLREGVDVAVTKRDGTATMATVSRVIWSGDGKAICSIRR
jgi:hypothetical protein